MGKNKASNPNNKANNKANKAVKSSSAIQQNKSRVSPASNTQTPTFSPSVQSNLNQISMYDRNQGFVSAYESAMYNPSDQCPSVRVVTTMNATLPPNHVAREAGAKGNCFYHSVAFQTRCGYSDDHEGPRDEAIGWAKDNRDIFQNIINVHDEQMSVDDFICINQKIDCYATPAMIIAMCMSLNTTICVYMQSIKNKKEPIPGYTLTAYSPADLKECARPINILNKAHLAKFSQLDHFMPLVLHDPAFDYGEEENEWMGFVGSPSSDESEPEPEIIVPVHSKRRNHGKKRKTKKSHKSPEKLAIVPVHIPVSDITAIVESVPIFKKRQSRQEKRASLRTEAVFVQDTGVSPASGIIGINCKGQVGFLLLIF
jgi:hypothetical protein